MYKILSVLFLLVSTVLGVPKSVYFYYNTLHIQAGFSIIANNVIPEKSAIDKVIINPPIGTTIYKLVNWTYKIYWFDPEMDDGWSELDSNATFELGEAVYIFTPAKFDLTLAGIVSCGMNVTTISNGFTLLGSKTPVGGLIMNEMVLNPSHNDTIYIQNPSCNSFATYIFQDTLLPHWEPNEPILEKNVGFFYHGGGTTIWNQPLILPNLLKTPRPSVIRNIGDAFGLGNGAFTLQVGIEIKTGERVSFAHSEDLSHWENFEAYGPFSGTSFVAAYLTKTPIDKGYIRVNIY